MRNLLEEFLIKHDGVRYPTILGLREHIFTGRYLLVLLVWVEIEVAVLLLNITHLYEIYVADNVLLICAVSHLLHGLCQIRRLVLLLLGNDCWPTL